MVLEAELSDRAGESWVVRHRRLLATIGIALLTLIGTVLSLLRLSGDASPPHGSGPPPPPLIHTSTCYLDNVDVRMPETIYVGRPFNLRVIGEPAELAPQPTSTSSRDDRSQSCRVVVSLHDDDSHVSYGQARLVADLAVSKPSWAVVAGTPGPHELFLSIESPRQCIAECGVPKQLHLPFVADRDPYYRRSRDALDDVATEIQVQGRRDARIDAGVPSELEITVTVSGLSELHDFSETSLVLDSESAAIQLPSIRTYDLDLSAATDQVTSAIIVTAPSHHDFPAFLDVKLVGLLGSDTIEVAHTKTLYIDVRDEGWLKKYVLNQLSWISTALGIIGVIATWLVAWRRRSGSRRRTKDKPAPPQRTDRTSNDRAGSMDGETDVTDSTPDVRAEPREPS